MEWVFNQLVSRFLFSSSPLPFFSTAEIKKDEHSGGDQRGTRDPGLGVPHIPQTHILPEIPSQIEGKYADPLSQIENLRSNFSRFLARDGVSPDSPLAAKVLNRLHIAALLCPRGEVLRKSMTETDFSIRILLLGLTGAGKSAMVNSIFDEPRATTNPFLPETDHIREVVGTVNGVILKVVDTPGLLPPSVRNLRKNREILLSVRRFVRKSPPDVVLHLQRLETISSLGCDQYQLFDLVARVLGREIWSSVVLVMTHSFPEPPVGGGDYASRLVEKLQRCLRAAASDERLENPVVFAENHPGVSHDWRSHLFLVCVSAKVLGDAAALLGVPDSVRTGRREPLPTLSLLEIFSSFLRPRRLPPSPDEYGDPYGSPEDENEPLLPIRILTKAEFDTLTGPERREYLREVDYRETLHLKKRLKEEEEVRRSPDDRAAVPLMEMDLPPTFDADSHSHRYRGASTGVGPILDQCSWDHDAGFGGVDMEVSTEVEGVRASASAQVRADKREFGIRSECTAASRLTPSGTRCRAGVEVESVGPESVAFTVNGGVGFPSPVWWSRLGCGASATYFRGVFYGGVRAEDVVSIGETAKVVVGGGVMAGRGEAGYGGSVMGVVTGRDYPARSVFLALTAALVSINAARAAPSGGFRLDFRPVWGVAMSVQGEVGCRKKGALSLRVVTAEHPEIALLSLVAVFRFLLKKVKKSGEIFSRG